MSILTRLGKIGLGAWGVLDGPIGLGYDLARSPWTDDPELDGFVHTLVGRTIKRGSQTLENVFGPEGVIGAPVEAAPSFVRRPVGDVIHPVLAGDRWLYSNIVSHPLATVLYAGALVDSDQWQEQHGHPSELRAMFTGDLWRDSYHATQHKSVGQAMALNSVFSHDVLAHIFGGPGSMYYAHQLGAHRDILNPDDINKFEGTDYYSAASGLVDAYFSTEFDPLKFAGGVKEGWQTGGERRFYEASSKAGKQEIGEQLAKGATPEEAAAAGMEKAAKMKTFQISEFLKSKKFENWVAAFDDIKSRYSDPDMAAGAIKNELFPSHSEGAELGRAFAHADGAAQYEYVMRMGMGDRTAYSLMAEANPALAERMRNTYEESAMIKDPWYTPEYHNSPAYRPDVFPSAEAQAALEVLKVNPRIDALFGAFDREIKAPGVVGRGLNQIKTSEFYQAASIAKPVRVLLNKDVPGIIDPVEPKAVSQVDSMLRQAGVPFEERMATTGKWAGLQPEERTQFILDAEERALRQVAENHGVTKEEIIQNILEGGKQYRGATKRLLQTAEEDDHGRSWVTIPGLDEHVRIPFDPEKAANAVPVINMRMLDKEFNTWSRMGFDRALDPAQNLMNSTMKLWRAGVLLRPAWPIRVMGEHGAAMSIKLNNLVGANEDLRAKVKDYASWKKGMTNYYSRLAEELNVKWWGGTGALFGAIVGGPLGIPVGGAIGAGMQWLGRSIEEVPYKQSEINGYLVHGAMGNEWDKNSLWKGIVSSRGDLDVMFGRNKIDPRTLMPDPGDNRTFLAGHPEFPAKYEELVNETLAKNPVARVALAHQYARWLHSGEAELLGFKKEAMFGLVEGEDVLKGGRPYVPAGLNELGYLDQYTSAEAAHHWLVNTPEGRAHMAENPLRARDPEAWAGSVDALVSEAIAGNPTIAQAMLNGKKVTHAQLERSILGKSITPEIEQQITALLDEHGSLIQQTTGPSFMKIRGSKEGDFDRLYREWKQGGEVKVQDNIPIKDVITNQNIVDPEVVLANLRQPQSPGAEKVWAIKVGDKYFVAEGNHRVNAAILRGEETVPAEVFVTPKFTKVPGLKDKVDVPDYGLRADLDKMPTVHPEYSAQVTGKSKVVKGLQGGIEKFHTVLGTLPLDALINEPYFARVFKYEMEQKLVGIPPGELTVTSLRRMEETARRTSVTRMRDLMYDFADRSEFANMVRTVMPFYPAWQQALQRWAGLAWENPTAINTARQILQAPGKMGLTWKDPDSGEEFVRLRLPEFAKSLIGHGAFKHALDDQGYFRFQTKGLSLAGEGLPGFGPFVDVALSPFVKENPALVDSLKVVYPFGSAPENIVQTFLPPGIQRTMATADENSRAQRAAYNRIIVTRLVRMQTGELPMLNLDDPEVRSAFLKDAHEEAQNFMGLRAVTGAFLPAAVQYDTPYQPIIDKYREMLKADPEGAQDKFLDENGEEFFALTQAFTKLNNGIPASIQGEADYEKYKTMVQKFPQYGALITGAEGTGSASEFSAAVYNKQRTTPIRPGSDVMQRSPLSGEEIVQSADARLGWTKFTRMMDLLDAELNQRGLGSYNVKGAADLRVYKDLAIQSVANTNPQWYAEYSVRDEAKWSNNIAALSVIAKDPVLKQRPEIEGLAKYLEARASIVGLLQLRESHGLDAQSNADLRILWDTVVNRMKNDDGGLAFSALYNRYLVHDPISPVGPNTLGIDYGTGQ